MEKLVYLLWKANDLNHEQFRDKLIECAPLIQNKGIQQLRINVVDQDVDAAKAYRIDRNNPQIDGILTGWLDTAQYHHAIDALLKAHVSKAVAYVVSESEPLPNRLYPGNSGQRTYGMNEVVLLSRPDSVPFDEWIDIWQNSHTQIAMDTQSTFGYRQNVVVRKIHADAPDVDAIVEENFPPEAMSDRTAFYDCPGDQDTYKERENIMVQSVSRFIEFDKMDCVPMSEYNF